MKKIGFLFLVALTATVNAVTVGRGVSLGAYTELISIIAINDSGPNILPNGSFEDGLTSWGANGNVQVQDWNASCDTYSLVVNGWNTSITFLSSQYITGSDNYMNYLVSGKVYFENNFNVTQPLKVNLQSTGTVASIDLSSMLATRNEWQDFSFIFRSPTGKAVRLTITTITAGGADQAACFIDCLEVRPITGAYTIPANGLANAPLVSKQYVDNQAFNPDNDLNLTGPLSVSGPISNGTGSVTFDDNGFKYSISSVPIFGVYTSSTGSFFYVKNYEGSYTVFNDNDGDGVLSAETEQAAP